MKKFLIILFLLVFSFLLAGCAQKDSDDLAKKPADEKDVSEKQNFNNKEKIKTDSQDLLEEDEKMPEEIFVYYNNTKKDPNMSDCSKVYPLKRELVDQSEHEEVNALVTLTMPLSQQEKEQGFVSNIPEGTQLVNLRISGEGLAYADFTEELNSGGGSCSMLARRAQIEQTLLQFPTIDKVIISVNGRTEDILQP